MEALNLTWNQRTTLYAWMFKIQFRMQTIIVQLSLLRDSIRSTKLRTNCFKLRLHSLWTKYLKYLKIYFNIKNSKACVLQDTMNLIDPQMKSLLIASYVGFTVLVCISILIAYVSTKFNRWDWFKFSPLNILIIFIVMFRVLEKAEVSFNSVYFVLVFWS